MVGFKNYWVKDVRRTWQEPTDFLVSWGTFTLFVPNSYLWLHASDESHELAATLRENHSTPMKAVYYIIQQHEMI